MFFHRAIGKVTFPIIALAFMALSVQTTWQFLNAALPHESLIYRVLGLAVFELGAFCWFSLLTSGAENVLRTIIALIMTVICVGGVATAAVYEVGSQMTDIGFKMDPAFLQWTPVCVLIGFIATLVSTLLYMAASPHVAHRFAHLNATGQEPPIGSHIERIDMLAPRQNTQQLAPRQQQLALPAPKQQAPAGIQQSHKGGIRAGIGNFFARLGAGLQNGPATYAPVATNESGADDVDEPAETADSAHDVEQEDVQEEEVVLMQSAAPTTRQTPVRKRVTSSAQATRRKAADVWGLLDIISEKMPDKTNADLARMVGCDVSTVRRWRASRGGK